MLCFPIDLVRTNAATNISSSRFDQMYDFYNYLTLPTVQSVLYRLLQRFFIKHVEGPSFLKDY